MQFLVQVYLPSFMFVVTSWVSFLIKPEVVPGRYVSLSLSLSFLILKYWLGWGSWSHSSWFSSTFSTVSGIFLAGNP